MKFYSGYTLILASLMFGLLVGTAPKALGAEPAIDAGTNNSPPPAAVTAAVTPPPPPATTDVPGPSNPTPANTAAIEINSPAPLDPSITAAISAAENAANAARVESAKAAQLQAEQNEKLFRSYLMLQEQLHEAVGAIQKNREEAVSAAVQNANAVASRLELIESSLASSRSRDLEAVQASNHLILVISAVFASVGLIALVLAAWFQLRAINRFAEISANRQAPYALPPHHSYPVDDPFPPDDPHALHEPGFSNRLGSVIESLENRVRELEQTPQPPLKRPTAQNGTHIPNEDAESESDTPASSDPSDPVFVLVNKGQALLHLNKPAEALACFEKALKIDPTNTEAWIKKGTALERLKRLEEAISSYDRAIAADESLTLAYLYKGGVFNQLERFNEALECYEQALRSQDQAEATQPAPSPSA